jgi:hypothetical protein
MTTTEMLQWLSMRFYVFMEFSPAQDSVVDVYNITKYGEVRQDTRRTFIGADLEDALKKAYLYESTELAKQ